MAKVLGRRVDFDDGRIVFLGTNADKLETAYIGFRNAEGKDLYLTLSWEALDALCTLRSDLKHYDLPPVEPYPHKREEVRSSCWVVVSPPGLVT